MRDSIMIKNVSKKKGVIPAVPMMHRLKMMANRSLSIFVMNGFRAIIIVIATGGAETKYSTDTREYPEKCCSITGRVPEMDMAEVKRRDRDRIPMLSRVFFLFIFDWVAFLWCVLFFKFLSIFLEKIVWLFLHVYHNQKFTLLSLLSPIYYNIGG